jgi:signal transduction histidine kinase
MVEHEQAGLELAALLKQHQEEIATGWAEKIQGLRGTFYGELPTEEVRSVTREGVEAIAESLETGSHTLLDEYLGDICPAGSGAMPDTSAVTEALLLCKDATLPVICEACDADSGEILDLVSELDALLRWMVARLSRMCAADVARRLADEEERVQVLLDMAETVSSSLDLDEVVGRASDQMVDTLGVDGCTFILVDEERRSTVYLRRPSDWSCRFPRSFDSYARAFHELLTTREPTEIYDVQLQARIHHDEDHKTARELGVKSSLGVPLMAKGQVKAQVWLYTLDECRHFCDADIALARAIGQLLGLVIHNAQLYEQSKRLAVMEERARLSREIHDGLAQTLGALQLKASQLEDSLSGELAGESRDYLFELQGMISRAYRDLREAMFGLRAVVEPGKGLVAALREYLAQYRAQYGLDVQLEVSGEEPVVLDGETQAQAMRIVQEALSNVRRHAGTGRATVSIEREGDQLRICIVDEGRGFDLGSVEERVDGLQLGLRIMRERAESVGGSFVVESFPGKGTRAALEFQGLRNGRLG